MHDMIITNGLLVDGSGGEPVEADIAIDGGLVSAVGKHLDRGREEIDARGRIVAPGFVDIHTHYDGQATWDPVMAPSAWHGVTTVVMGNCGVGFAPVRPDRHEWLIGLMEGVEDIPGTALSEGIKWGWETFPEYLDAIAGMRRTIDVGCLVPHGALRAYVMGERGARDELPREGEIEQMSAMVEEALRAGALGFSTSRTVVHRSIDGVPVPGTTASKVELMGIGRAMGRVGHGVFELATDLHRDWDEFGWMADLSRETGLPVVFAMLQSVSRDLSWREQMVAMAAANARGAHIRAQFAPRGIGVLMGWQTTFNPFVYKPLWRELAALPWPERLERLCRPDVRAQLIGEVSEYPANDIIPAPLQHITTDGFTLQYEMGDRPSYEPEEGDSIAVRAAKAGVSEAEYAFDLLMRDEGRGFIYMPILNYADGNLDFVRELLMRDDTVVSLSDGGAHCGTICDAATPTFLLTHWARDRSRGTVPIERVIAKQCRDTALLYGLPDRGLLAPGYAADLNVIDFDALCLEQPYVAHDLPAGGRRLLQRAKGYVATIKSGEITFRDGEPTGAHPGVLVRGGARQSKLKIAA